MHALSTFVDRLVFAATCILGWLIFPLIIAAGFIALLVHALIVELVSSTFRAPPGASRDAAPTRGAAPAQDAAEARRAGDRFGRTVHP